jgi:hypothetical protein
MPKKFPEVLHTNGYGPITVSSLEKNVFYF